ncbi:MAG: DNA polymerase [Verrucomicrobia bacterium Tous-C9LFEB]|nr:MAG: DNA polymerase [Verrucomicrobia bacterium Tous-C9LFEB]
MPLRSLFVDFNSYFASVEQQTRPELRNRPVGVVPVLSETTCCIAASYEAKQFGVKTGTLVHEARKLCPRIRIVEARPEIYVRYHNDLVAAVDSVLPVSSIQSIDEMACDLNGPFQQREKALALAHQVKATIASRVGPWMKCSIGIAPNDFLAKTASDMQKPNGLVVIESHDLPQCLYHLELRDFCGIGRNMDARLRQHGICTVEALCTASASTLRRAWGSIEGERLHAKLRGEVVYSPPTQKSSISHSHVLAPELRNDADAYSVLNRLLQKAAMRLRKDGYLAGAMGIYLKYTGGNDGWHQEMHFQETQDTIEFLRVMETLWQQRPSRPPGAPMQVGVYLLGLTDLHCRTLPLFGEGKARPALNAVVDKLNTLYGKNTVYFGGAHTALQSAPMRIAFNRIPDIETESDDC